MTALLDLRSVKAFLRVDHHEEDLLIQSICDAAEQYLVGPDGVLGLAAKADAAAGFPIGVPAPIQTAAMMHVATLYDNRTFEAAQHVPGGAYQALLAPYRDWV